MYRSAQELESYTGNSPETLEDKRKREEVRRISDLQLAKACSLADTFLNHSYLDFFSEGKINPLNDNWPDVVNKIKIFKISKMVYDKAEIINDKFISVYGALHNLGSRIAAIVRSIGGEIEFYIATFSESSGNTSGLLMQSALKNNFPGIKMDSALASSEAQSLLESIISNASVPGSIASVSLIPSERDENKEKFAQGMEKFASALIGKDFTAIFLAEPVSRETLSRRKLGFEELASQLSPHGKVSMSFAHSETTSVNESLSLSFSDSINNSVSNTQGTSVSQSNGVNQNSGSSFGFNGSGWNMGTNDSNGSYSAYTSGTNFSESISSGTTKSKSDSRQKGSGTSLGDTDTTTLTFENKSIQGLIERADAQIKRISFGESYGMWDFCAYFIAEDVSTTIQAANMYKSIMMGNESSVERAHVNIWMRNTKKNEIRKICSCLMNFGHPVASLPVLNNGASVVVNPTQMVSGKELPMAVPFPRKSLPGFAVMEMAEFGRSVVFENPEKKRRTIDLGQIHHMGESESNHVPLDIDLLAAHCFITGSSGSGKSYFTYQLLSRLLEAGIKMMVIEPAKGEYKQVFGGFKGIRMFTADPKANRLLRINPFQFPENIHALAHIEKLMQIFNASWALYAAMPAILKAAVVKAYTRCGWDVMNSIFIGEDQSRKYPTFKDILGILPNMIENSDYSSDAKGDYKGALLTRVQSMTTGLTRLVFERSEGIADNILFDANSIVDLSEIGSDETIALLMGILIMRLGEYRQSQRKSGTSKGRDSELAHVTVLEEAHNLLKRTSKEQSQEGSNIVGKSVEMIANSIKELRTYGEGFVIIDQSPMAVDQSAIENTSTKVIFNTPARDACTELASSLSLDESQSKELSRLNTGVAAIFQKGWLMPVLMKVGEWQNSYEKEIEPANMAEFRELRGHLIDELHRQHVEKKYLPQKLKAIISASGIDAEKKKDFDEIVARFNGDLLTRRVKGGLDLADMGSYYLDISGCEGLFDAVEDERIMSCKEMERLGSDDDIEQIFQKQKQLILAWGKRFFDALPIYAAIDDVQQKHDIFFALLEYMARENPDSRIDLICQMLKAWDEKKNAS